MRGSAEGSGHAGAWQAGLLGVAMGLAVVVVTGIPLFLADRITGGNGIAGVAAASTAGNAAAVPAIVAAANPAYADAARPATILVAACVVVTAILTPIVTAWVARMVGRDVAEPEAGRAGNDVAAGDQIAAAPRRAAHR